MERAQKPRTERAEPGPHRALHHHGGEAGAIAGEIVGAVLGSAAGPPGVMAGMVIGAAAGALAGEVLDQEAERTSRHDHELDDAIGVTKGDLGRSQGKK
jgi:outer membrane lipoprotein SlyB